MGRTMTEGNKKKLLKNEEKKQQQKNEFLVWGKRRGTHAVGGGVSTFAFLWCVISVAWCVRQKYATVVTKNIFNKTNTKKKQEQPQQQKHTPTQRGGGGGNIKKKLQRTHTTLAARIFSPFHLGGDLLPSELGRAVPFTRHNKKKGNCLLQFSLSRTKK